MALFTQERTSKLNDLEFEVYNCILKLERQVLHMKIRQLADMALVSTTVVLNFCKKMDCGGWTEFKLKYKESLEDEQSIDYTLSVEPLVDSLRSFEKDDRKKRELECASRFVLESEQVIFVGAGPSGILAKYGGHYLSNLGKQSQYIDAPYYPTPSKDYSKVVVIGLSVSGETPSIISKLTTFKSLGAKIISITSTKENTVSRLSDLAFSYHVLQEEFYIDEKAAYIHVNMTSQIPVMYLIERISKGYDKLRKN